jgi:hypothetical protein
MRHGTDPPAPACSRLAGDRYHAVVRAFLAAAMLAAGCSVRDEEVRPAAMPKLWPATPRDAAGLDTERRTEIGGRGIEYVEGYAAGRRRASAEGLPMLIVFRATWCRWSGELTKGPLTDRGVITAAHRFVCVTVDADRDAETCRDFGVSGFPTVIVLDTTGVERFRATGAAAAARLAVVMHELLGGSDRPERYAGGLDDAQL